MAPHTMRRSSSMIARTATTIPARDKREAHLTEGHVRARNRAIASRKSGV